MNSKDILQAYINTLSDKECKDIYMMLMEVERNKGKYAFYNEEADVDDKGLIKLTPKQYHALFTTWGESKTKECFKLLYNYLNSGKKVRASHYNLLKGWIETLYQMRQQKKIGRPKKVIEIPFNKVQSKAEARLYIANVPSHLRSDDPCVSYLVNKYGVDIL